MGVFDIKLKDMVDMARDRGLFTDQGESLNSYFKNQDNMKVGLLEYLLYTWNLGLKTGSYYCHTLQTVAALDFTGVKLTEPECLSCSS